MLFKAANNSFLSADKCIAFVVPGPSIFSFIRQSTRAFVNDSNIMFSTAIFVCGHPAFIAILIFIIVITVACYVVRFQNKSSPPKCRDTKSLNSLESSHLLFQQSRQSSILSFPWLNTPPAPIDLPIGDCVPGCAHIVSNYPTIPPFNFHQNKTYNTDHTQPFAKRYLPDLSRFISGLTHSDVYRRVRQMMSRDRLLVPGAPINAPLPLGYQRHLFPSATRDLPYAGELC